MSGISLVWKSREFIDDSVLMVVHCRFVDYSLQWGNKNVDCQKHQDPWEKKETVQISLYGIKRHMFPPKRKNEFSVKYQHYLSRSNLWSEIILLLSQKQKAFYFRFPAWKSLYKLKLEGKTATKKNLRRRK